MTTFDIIIIGSGPGGYTAAVRASQLGYKTAIIEKYGTLGGTCTNVGCIPTKALLDSSEHFHKAHTKFDNMGIQVADLQIDISRFFKRKDEVVIQNVNGINFLMKKNSVAVLKGTASFQNTETVIVRTPEMPDEHLTARYFIIATGSKPMSIPGVKIDKERIISSTEALALNEVPASLTIIGGGVIGVEMASIFARIGTRVTILEYADALIPVMDKELGKELQKILSKIGVDILLNQKVQSAVNNGRNVTVSYLNTSQQAQQISSEYCLVAVGRAPYTAGLGLENAGIETDKKAELLPTRH